MFTKKCLFVPAALVCVGFICTSAANAEDPEKPKCYTVASLQGSYAVVTNYGAYVALALARRYFDGEGNLTGTFTLNQPKAGSTTGERAIVTGTQVGTYTVNCDGTGVITRVVTASNGVTANQEDDFIITGAIEKGGKFIATALADATRVPSAIVPGGLFVTRVYTRLPDHVVSPTP